METVMNVLAAVTREAGRLSFETVELSAPKATEALVRIVACGVCHTDAAALHAVIPVTFPIILGHEGVGVVEAVGSDVASLKRGDRVVLTFPSCGKCAYCLNDRPYACDHMNRLFFEGVYSDGTKRVSQNGTEISSFFGQGAFAGHVIVDARNAVRVDVATDDGLACLCSLGCGVQTGAGAVFNRIKPSKGEAIAVFGCGGVGMSAVMAAAIAGCSPIIGVDVELSRLELARELGATHAVDSRRSDPVAEIGRITGGGAHYSVEASGIAGVTLQALGCLRREGTAVLLSVTGAETISLPLEACILNPGVTLTGLTEGASNPQTFIPELVNYYNEGRLPVDRLVKFYDFRDIEKAFDDSHRGLTVKPVLRWW